MSGYRLGTIRGNPEPPAPQDSVAGAHQASTVAEEPPEPPEPEAPEPEPATGYRPLTAHEQNVYDMTRQGLSQRVIALQLGISRSAVRDRLREAERKLEWHHR